MEDRIIVPKNLRTTVISLLHKRHPAINKMTLAARHFWWPPMTEAFQKKCESCILAKCPVRVLNLMYRTWKKSLTPVDIPNEEIQLDFIGPITECHRQFYILLPIDRFSKWSAVSLCEYTDDGEMAVKFLNRIYY